MHTMRWRRGRANSPRTRVVRKRKTRYLAAFLAVVVTIMIAFPDFFKLAILLSIIADTVSYLLLLELLGSKG